MTLLMVLALLFVAAPAFAAAGDGYEFPWKYWVAGMLNLAIYIGILWKFALPPIQKFFAGRRDAFVYNLETSARLRKEAEAKLEEYSARLDALDKEREALLNEYHVQGEREKERMIEAAKKQVEKMRADAEATIAQEVKKAVAMLEQQAVDLAVEMAHRMAQEKIDRTTQSQLVAGYVKDLETQKRISN
jgi:F-type H+-transporting ATPase subunit b